MKKVIIVILIVASIFLFIDDENNVENFRVVNKSLGKVNFTNTSNYSVRLLNNKNIETLDMEEYIVGVVACEMPASFHPEALKALAVAARTYALNKLGGNKTYDLENSTNHQCYNSPLQMKEKWGSSFNKYYSKIFNAVYETQGQVLTYDGKIIQAFYFSTSNGYTENVENVFSQKLSYLVSVESPWDKINNYYTQTKTIDIKTFLNKVGTSLSYINKLNIERYKTNYVKKIIVNEKTFSGTLFQSKFGLNSFDFSIKYDNQNVYITTKGWGHSVGMSQYGANGMANEGYSYTDILFHYYTDVELNYA